MLGTGKAAMNERDKIPCLGETGILVRGDRQQTHVEIKHGLLDGNNVGTGFRV